MTFKASVDCPDIEAHSSSGGVLGGIQGGLGFLMGAIGAAVGGTTAGYLERADVLMVVILGGVTFTEVAMLKQLIADTGKQVCIIFTIKYDFSTYNYLWFYKNLLQYLISILKCTCWYSKNNYF